MKLYEDHGYIGVHWEKKGNYHLGFRVSGLGFGRTMRGDIGDVSGFHSSQKSAYSSSSDELEEPRPTLSSCCKYVGENLELSNVRQFGELNNLPTRK